MIQLVIAGLIFIAGMASGWKIHMGITAQRELERVAAVERETLRRVDKIDASAEKHEKTKEVIRERFIPITMKVTDEIIRYRDAACLSPLGLQLIADSIAAIAPAASVPSRPMRPASSP